MEALTLAQFESTLKSMRAFLANPHMGVRLEGQFKRAVQVSSIIAILERLGGHVDIAPSGDILVTLGKRALLIHVNGKHFKVLSL